MRKIETFNENWFFSKENVGADNAARFGIPVTLPHTWNAEDGTDGGNDYYRGTCWYVKKFNMPKHHADEEVWVQFEGAAMTAEVYLNGTSLGIHKGGYSTFRMNLTDGLAEGENILAVSVDNSENDTVYPQKADFTFYGGLYRNVSLITVPKAHIALGYHGGQGVKVTPAVEGKSAVVTVEAWVEGYGKEMEFTIGDLKRIAVVTEGYVKVEFVIENVHLWDGIKDPYLYTLDAILDGNDNVQVTFGCRSFEINAQNGFVLNGRPYPLCGAARHQDHQGIGNALTRAEHEEDLKLIREMGANTVRLAHYQHDQYFYDLCDKYGMIVWAEIPYITKHMENGRENTVSQMTELVVQNYAHPSIVCWGLSNEITVDGGVTEDMVENHRILNELCHRLDSTRPTTMAHAFMLDMEDAFVMLPDVRSYNLYYGWYLGELEQNDEFFDAFHAAHPDAAIGLSEYGADANPAYQNGAPRKGDWSEPYQAVYHEHLLKMWSERPYIWAMHCWNMFDFGADGRDEGGKPGQNQKGLVTFDRKTKKDAFYIYKAYLSDEPFVHICGRRYVDRTENVTEVKVYSNQPEVTLYVDGHEYAARAGEKVFVFNVPISGEHTFEARSKGLTDKITIRKMAEPNPAYFITGAPVVNWFDKPEELIRKGFYSILDSIEAIKQNPAGAALIGQIMQQAAKSYGDVAKDVKMPEAIQRQMDRMPLQKLLEQAGKAIPPQMVKELNAALNQIPKI